MDCNCERPQTKNMGFGVALMYLRDGRRVAREGWNGKGMYLYYIHEHDFPIDRAPLNKWIPNGTVVHYRSHIDMRDAQGCLVPWLASQTDILAYDWMVVD